MNRVPLEIGVVLGRWEIHARASTTLGRALVRRIANLTGSSKGITTHVY